MTPTDPTTAGKTPTPTPDQVEAETRAEFLHLHKAPKDWLIVTESEVAALKAELAAKDAELMTARQEKNSYKRAATELAEEHLEETEKLHAQLATLRQQLEDANEANRRLTTMVRAYSVDPSKIGNTEIAMARIAQDEHTALLNRLTASEQANAALRAEVERPKGALELGQENCDAEYDRLRDERDEMTRIAQDASRGELAAIQRESAFKAAADRLAGALVPILKGDCSFCALEEAHEALAAHAKLTEGQP